MLMVSIYQFLARTFTIFPASIGSIDETKD